MLLPCMKVRPLLGVVLVLASRLWVYPQPHMGLGHTCRQGTICMLSEAFLLPSKILLYWFFSVFQEPIRFWLYTLAESGFVLVTNGHYSTNELCWWWCQCRVVCKVRRAPCQEKYLIHHLKWQCQQIKHKTPCWRNQCKHIDSWISLVSKICVSIDFAPALALLMNVRQAVSSVCPNYQKEPRNPVSSSLDLVEAWSVGHGYTCSMLFLGEAKVGLLWRWLLWRVLYEPWFTSNISSL